MGPTGVGKTVIGFRAAELLNGEIISADSRQMYRGMDIGTDKPPVEFLERLPHYFIDILDPDEDYNAGQFGKDARRRIEEILFRHKVPFIIGGSGLYIKSLLEGFFDEKVKDRNVKKRLRERADKEGNEILYAELIKADPEFALRISVNDTQRIIRGLEVYLVTGKRLTRQWKESKKSADFQYKIIGLRRERAELYDIINKRVEIMLERGLIDEVKVLQRRGYSHTLNAMQTYGYRETFRYLQGKFSYEELIEQIKKQTRNFAKRQLTWFRKFENISWLDVGDDTDRVVDTIISIVQSNN